MANEALDLRKIARELAASHQENDPSIERVYFVPDPDGHEVRLVEVSSELSTTNEVFPVRFGARADLGVPVPSAVVLLSEEEWNAVKSRELELPAGWTTEADPLLP
jgi:hypothetical protein